MDLSILLLGTVMIVLLLAGAGLLSAMVLLERRGAELAPAPALAGRAHTPNRSHAHCTRPRKGRRRAR